MNVATINHITYKVPGNWEELSTWQKDQVLSLLFAVPALPEYTLKLQVLKILLRLKRRPSLYWLLAMEAGFENIDDLIPLTDFVFKKHIPLPFPKIKVKGKTFFPPEEGLKNITFYEFVSLEQVIQSKENLAHKVASILYRKAKSPLSLAMEKTGLKHYNIKDIRQPLAKDDGELMVRHLPNWQANAILYWYLQEIVSIKERYQELFTPSENTTADAPSYTWTDALMDMAETADRIEAVGSQPLLNTFFQIKRQIIRKDKLEEALANQTT